MICFDTDLRMKRHRAPMLKSSPGHVSFARLWKINSHTRHLRRWRYKRPVTPWLWGTAETRWTETPVEPLVAGSKEWRPKRGAVDKRDPARDGNTLDRRRPVDRRIGPPGALRGQAEGKGANRTARPDHERGSSDRCADLRCTQVIEARFAVTGKVCTHSRYRRSDTWCRIICFSFTFVPSINQRTKASGDDPNEVRVTAPNEVRSS
jgi:hypothetical protein